MGGSCFILSSCRLSILLLLLYCAPGDDGFDVGVNDRYSGSVEAFVFDGGVQVILMGYEIDNENIVAPRLNKRFGVVVKQVNTGVEVGYEEIAAIHGQACEMRGVR